MKKITAILSMSILSVSVFATTQFNFIEIPPSTTIAPYSESEGSEGFGEEGGSVGGGSGGSVSKIVLTTSGGGDSWVTYEYLAGFQFFEEGVGTAYDTGVEITSDTLAYETDKIILSISDHWPNGTFYFPENILQNPDTPNGTGVWAEIWVSLNDAPSVITVEFKTAIELSDLKFSPYPVVAYGQSNLSFVLEVFDETGVLSKTININPTNQDFISTKIYNLNIATEDFTELAESVDF